MIKLSKYAKKMGLSYATCYNMFKTNRLPVKAIQLETGTILVDETRELNCVVKDINGKYAFSIKIDVDIDTRDLEKEEKELILVKVKDLAIEISHKMGIRIDEKSVRVL